VREEGRETTEGWGRRVREEGGKGDKRGEGGGRERDKKGEGGREGWERRKGEKEGREEEEEWGGRKQKRKKHTRTKAAHQSQIRILGRKQFYSCPPTCVWIIVPGKHLAFLLPSFLPLPPSLPPLSSPSFLPPPNVINTFR
jgi:hypothetical protein